MKWRKRIALAVGIVIAVGLVVSWLVGGMLLAPKPLVIGPPPGELQAEPIALESESGSTLAGWHLPVPDAQAVLVLGHGVRGSRLDSLRRAVLWQEAGYAVVIIDLQAHGESPGAHITVGHLEQHDIRAAVAFAKAGYASARVGVLGMSMGGAAAILASPLDIDALVIESVYPTFREAIHNRVAEHLGPLAGFPAFLLLAQIKPRIGISPAELCPIDHITKVRCPIFVISGAEDTHTRAAETEALFAAAQEPKQLWLVPNAGHVDLHEAAGADYEARVTAFWDQHLRQ
ncbi:MAG: fermentation-respiration switch protein FrsA (DUF1100 family) [Rhodothermales bacterium]|jgi:fermentation-respiration switch protein FrsA (DUF1100 family)